VLDILDIEYDAKRDDGDDGGPESEVAGPDATVVFNLEGCLYGGGQDERSDSDLLPAC
jgi:hypothetical protein